MPAQPFPQRIGNELGTIVEPDMLGRAMLDEQVGQDVYDIVRPETWKPCHDQAFPAELVDNVEHPEFATVMHLILNKLIGPHMPAMLRAQPDGHVA